MLDTQGFITKIRNIIADSTSLSLNDIYSPDLPQEKENIVAVTLLTGNVDYNLCGQDYWYPTFRTLIRGSKNDAETRALCDEVYNALQLKEGVIFNSFEIVQILATTTPIFVGKDENQRNLYNITFQAKAKKKGE